MFELQRQEIKNPVGVYKDLSPSDIPIKAWSDVMNVKFKDGKVMKACGYQRAFGDMPGDRKPLFAMPYLTNRIPYWFFGFEDRIFRTSGDTWQDVTRGAGTTPVPYAAEPSFTWNGGFLSGVAIMNNGKDLPQSLTPTTTYFQDLPNWPVGTRAKIMRPFKNYLIAMNITKDSTEQPSVVKWSSPADPGNVPSSWDVTSPLNDSGEAPLADTPGSIVDGKTLRDQFIIYKEDSVYSMRYVGGVFVFAFQQLYDDVGVLATNCVAEFDGKHFVVGQGDVYVHNGVQKKSIIDGKMREYLFSGIRVSGPETVFVAPNYGNSEMWICFKSGEIDESAPGADRAVVWNWQTDTWSIREIPNVFAASYGVVEATDDPNWDSDNEKWNSDLTDWGYSNLNPAMLRVLLVSREKKSAYVVGQQDTYNGVPFLSTFEKTNIYNADDLGVKNVNAITPHIKGTGTANVYIGSSMLQDSPVTWQGPYQFLIGRDHCVPCRVNGRYVGVRFEIPSTGSWELNGYTIEYAQIGGKR